MQTEITSDQMSSDECNRTERGFREFFLAAAQGKGGMAIHVQDVYTCVRRWMQWQTSLQRICRDPEDFIQTFLAYCWLHGLEYYQPGFCFTQYAALMLKHTASQLRPEYRNEWRRQPFSVIEGKAANDPAVPDAASQNLTCEEIMDAIDHLPEPLKRAAREVLINMRTAREAAEILGISENAVRLRVRRAKALICPDGEHVANIAGRLGDLDDRFLQAGGKRE